MAQIQCNFFSYALGHGVDIAVTLPSFTPCNMDQEHTHQLPENSRYFICSMATETTTWCGTALPASTATRKRPAWRW